MTCYHPMRAYRYRLPDGTYKQTFKRREAIAHPYEEIMLPCKRCIGCDLDYSVEVAVRAVHESMCWSKNCFITLTVDDDHIDQIFPNYDLNKEEFKKFAKRFRKIASGVDFFDPPVEFIGKRKVEHYPIRIMYCGEYGSKYYRPHYHALIFNYDFPDKYFYKIDNGVVYYRSPTLEKLWPYGFSTIGDVSFNSAAYVARYCTKKLFLNDYSPQKVRDEYQKKYIYIDQTTGEVKERMKEFIEFPRGFGLGKWFLFNHEHDIYDKTRLESSCRIMKKGEVKSFPVPDFYDRFELDKDELFMQDLKRKRKKLMRERADEYSRDRLMTKEKLAELCKRLLVRKLENDY